MFETVISLRPKSEWRRVRTWYSDSAPEWLKPALRRLTRDHISIEDLIAEMNQAVKLPGLSNAWTMPIKGRVDMLNTGVRTPIGLSISGPDPKTIQSVGARIEAALAQVKGARSVFAERTASGLYLDFDWKREELARYGLSVEHANIAVQNSIGGETVTTIIAGRNRYPVNVRYMQDFRSDLSELERVLVPVSGERQIPIGDIARISMVEGPAMLRNVDGMLTGYVYIDVGDSDPNVFMAQASHALAQNVAIPPGYTITWVGQYQAAQQAHRRLFFIVPAVLLIIVLLLYTSTRSAWKVALIALAVPFSAIGAVWLLWILGYKMSIAVWVGVIALLGLDAETGVFMLMYLDLTYEQALKDGKASGRIRTTDRDRPRRGATDSSEVDDGHRCNDRFASYLVVGRNWFRRFEADHRPYDWWVEYIVSARIASIPRVVRIVATRASNLCHLAGEHGCLNLNDDLRYLMTY